MRVTEAETTWRPVEEADLPALVALSTRVLAADGGLPVAGEEAFVRRRFVDGATDSTAAYGPGGELVAVAAVRAAGDGAVAAGLVDPAWRGKGLGGRLVDWALARAGRIETEALTGPGDELFRRRGLHQAFAEDVMRFDLANEPPPMPFPPDVAITPWTPELADRFFAVYEAAFRDRPGFPGWPAEQWIEWISGDEEFAPDWTLLATAAGTDLGFVASAVGAWVVQVGVRPQARGAGLGAALTAEALRRMRADGVAQAFLDVNVDNPGAARVYARLGFVHIGRRARYEHG